MSAVTAIARSVRQLLTGRKYTVDYFQRDYRWGEKQINELLTDLTSKFMSSWKESHERIAVAKFAPYFLGSVIMTDDGDDGRRSIIDGQQRLTSLTLLLIALRHRLEDEHDRGQLADLIFTLQYGSRSFNLDVPDRLPAMQALYNGEPFAADDQPESVRCIVERYEDLGELLPKEFVGKRLAMFADWVIDRVFLVEIGTPDEDGGYEVFEAMNDRGLALSPTEMLKSHLLSRVGDDVDEKRQLNEFWKARIKALTALGREEDADAIKSWLRGRYARTIRERQAGAQPQDFDRIGTEFHRWVRDNAALLTLSDSDTYRKFVRQEFDYYTKLYERLRHFSQTLTARYETIYCNADSKFTLQYPLMLAPVLLNESEESAMRKVRIVARFVDILITRRMWHRRSNDYSTMQYAMFLVIKEIRGCGPTELVDRLSAYLEKETEPFSAGTDVGYLTLYTKTLRRLLARITAWVEVESSMPNRLDEYLQSAGAAGHDIEHIWANKFERHVDEFSDRGEFDRVRNLLGGLLLLPKKFNRSYGDLPYRAAEAKDEKYAKYYGQNLLAKSLHENAYTNEPGFTQMIGRTGLSFSKHPQFSKADLETRHQLYVDIANQIWSIDRLQEEADA